MYLRLSVLTLLTSSLKVNMGHTLNWNRTVTSAGLPDTREYVVGLLSTVFSRP
ncbi:hypothetical protein D3C85_1834430 [compost metagenome]